MLKLSRRNWNNVLIFVVLILMYSLYDWSGTKTAVTAGARHLLPEQAQLLSVSIGQIRLVQAAGSWQLQPMGRAGVNAQQMAQAWQYTLLQPVVVTAGQHWVPVAQASVQLVGELAPQVWLLYPFQQGYILQQVGQSQFYQLTAAQARLLFLLE